jgi:hypothetical protein
MNKSILSTLFLFGYVIIFAQSNKLAKNSTFFIEIKKTLCTDLVSRDESNSNLNCQVEDMRMMINAITFISPLRIISNDSAKLSQCISLKRSEHLPIFKPCKICEIALEKALNCKILDTLINSEVWVLRLGKEHQLKPLVSDKYIEQFSNSSNIYRLGVYDPVEFGLSKDIYSENIIAKNGILSQILFKIESYSKHLIELEDETRKGELFTFEISKAILQSGNYEKIRDALKESVGFELDRRIQLTQVKYIKFFE